VAYVFSAAALLISVCTFFCLRASVNRRLSASRIPEETREAVAQIINEIDRITDRDSQLIEERVRALKTILAETDRRVQALAAALSAAPPAAPAAAPEAEAAPPEVVASPGAAALAARGLSSAAIAARLGKSVTEVEMELYLHRPGQVS
jgi:hypothetical protein